MLLTASRIERCSNRSRIERCSNRGNSLGVHSLIESMTAFVLIGCFDPSSGVDGTVRCWQHTATGTAGSPVSAAAWTELPALQSAAKGDEGASSSSGCVRHLWLASQSPPLLGMRFDGGRMILYDVDRSSAVREQAIVMIFRR
jgi:hypothetical protein